MTVLELMAAALIAEPVLIEDLGALCKDAHEVVGGGWSPRRPRAHAIYGRDWGHRFLRDLDEVILGRGSTILGHEVKVTA